jgi:hypothetical protein
MGKMLQIAPNTPPQFLHIDVTAGGTSGIDRSKNKLSEHLWMFYVKICSSKQEK